MSQQITLSSSENLKSDFLKRVEDVLNLLAWKKESQINKLTKEILLSLKTLAKEKEAVFIKSLQLGRFDKTICNLKYTLIVGDDAGLYLLMNTIPEENEKILTEERDVLSV